MVIIAKAAELYNKEYAAPAVDYLQSLLYNIIVKPVDELSPLMRKGV